MPQEHDDPGLADLAKEERIRRALLVDKTGSHAARIKKETYPDGWKEDPLLLNSYAWWCFENRVNLEEAEAFARRAVDRIGPGEEQANIMDTLAEIRHARGDTEDALHWIERALQVNPRSRYLRSQRERFRELLDD